MFAERGYHRSSIDNVAREGGISNALIYEHMDFAWLGLERLSRGERWPAQAP